VNGLHRHARDQWFSAAQSIPRSIAEGNGKQSVKDRSRFLEIARGSAMECAAFEYNLDVAEKRFEQEATELTSQLHIFPVRRPSKAVE